jgi:hypothetical protein
MRARLAKAAAVGVIASCAGCNAAIVAGAALLATSSGSSKNHDFAVPQPVVTSVSPAKGSHGGGSSISISGENFPANATVAIGDVAATSVVVANARTITAVVPRSNTTGAVSVTVTNPSGGTGTLSGGFTYENGLPTAAITDLPSPQTGNVVVSFTLADPESDPADLLVEMDSGNGFQAVAAQFIVSGPLTAFSTSPTGASHTLTIATSGLFPQQNVTSAHVRITPIDETDKKAGTAGTSNAFSIVNNTPPTVTIVQPSSGSFTVVLNYTITDPDSSDSLRVTSLGWRDLQTGASGNLTVAGSQGVGPVGFSAGGTRAKTLWDSLADLGYGNNKLVTVSVTVADRYTTTSATTAPFYVSNGPISPPVQEPSTRSGGFAVGDVTGDGFNDVVTASFDTIALLVNNGRGFDGAKFFKFPALPGTYPSTNPYPGNAFFTAATHGSESAILDMDGDGKLDLIVSSSEFGPNAGHPLVQQVSGALAAAAADAPNGYAHLIPHQSSLRVLQSGGTLDFANATWESTQAPIANVAPHVFLAGSSAFSSTATGDPGQDNVGWLVQATVAADLDGATNPGSGLTDLVIVNGINRLTKAYGGDARGCVVVRRADPTTKALGPTYYLDPTDMGAIPTHACVADVLSSTRATLPYGFTAPVGSKDIVVANSGDSSLTIYYQFAPAPSTGTAPPTYTSLHLKLSALIPGLPAGDTIGVAMGDMTGNGANELVVVGQLTQTAIVFVFDPSSALATATGGLFPFRVGAVLSLPQLLCGRPVVADVTNDGLADILIPNYIGDELLAFVTSGKDAQGNPTFAPMVTFAAGFQPNAIAAIDVNGDTRPDVVVGNYETGDVYVYTQVTPGTLIDQFVPIPSGDTPILPTKGDVTGDGIPEVICPVQNGNAVYVYGQDPVDLLKVIASYDLSKPEPGVEGGQPVYAAVGPVLHPGKNDILVAMTTIIDPSGIHGGFELVAGPVPGGGVAAVETASASSLGIDLGDLNGDGIPDVAVSSPVDNKVTVFYGQPGGGFVATVFTVPGTVFVKIVDLDGDGNKDLVATTNGGFAVFYGTGSGIATTYTFVDTSAYVQPATFEVGDVNSDGLLDLVAADYGTSIGSGGGVIYQTAPRTFAVSPLRIGGEAAGIAIGDVDGDGRNDVAISWGADDVVAIYTQDPAKKGQTGSLRPPVLYHTASQPSGCVILDVNGDGKNDVVVASRGANSLNVFLQR